MTPQFVFGRCIVHILAEVYRKFPQPPHTNTIRRRIFPSQIFCNSQISQPLDGTQPQYQKHSFITHIKEIQNSRTWFVTCIICHGVSNSVRCARRKNPPRAPAAGFLPIAFEPPACPCPSAECPIRACFSKLFRSALCFACRAHFLLWYCSQAKRDSWNYRLNWIARRYWNHITREHQMLYSEDNPKLYTYFAFLPYMLHALPIPLSIISST
jgi:hypothetical protein